MLNSKRGRILSLTLLPLVLAGLAYAIISWRPLTVAVAPVVENVPIRVFGLGTVEARVLSRIGFEVGAAITELNADHGDVVKQGQVLARLHASQQEAKVARAKAAVLSAEVAVKKADANIVKARAILAQRLEVNRRKQQLVDPASDVGAGRPRRRSATRTLPRPSCWSRRATSRLRRRSSPMPEHNSLTRRPYSSSTP